MFINTICAANAARYLGIRLQRLLSSIPVKGYDGNLGKPVSYYLQLYLTINGQRQYNIPFLILDLGSYDLILGREWLKRLKVLVDCDKGCLR